MSGSTTEEAVLEEMFSLQSCVDLGIANKALWPKLWLITASVL